MNDLFYKIILLLTFLGVITSIIIKFVIYHRSKNVFQEMKIILGKGDIFFPFTLILKISLFLLYPQQFKKKNPSENNQTYEKKILNVAFPDTLINYNVASFDSDSTVNIATKIPLDDIYFFSITIYLENGKVYNSLNNSIFETKTGTLNHTFLLKPSAEQTTDKSITIIQTPPKEMSPTYCVILRTYRKEITTTLFDPTLSVNDKELEYKSITPQKREENSNVIQTLLYFLFHLKLSKINVQTFFDVDAYKFFLPADNRMGLVFLTLSPSILCAFLKKKKNNYVLRIQGELQNNIGEENSTVSYVSFMASNFVKTSTDNSLMFKDITLSTKKKKMIANIGYMLPFLNKML